MSEWRSRFREALKKDGRSNRRLSLDSGFGHAFVTEMLDEADPREPSVANLRKLCEEMKVSYAWVTTGIDLTPEAEEVLAIYTMLPAEDRQALLRLTRAMRRESGSSDDDLAPGEAAPASRVPARR